MFKGDSGFALGWKYKGSLDEDSLSLPDYLKFNIDSEGRHIFYFLTASDEENGYEFSEINKAIEEFKLKSEAWLKKNSLFDECSSFGVWIYFAR